MRSTKPSRWPWGWTRQCSRLIPARPTSFLPCWTVGARCRHFVNVISGEERGMGGAEPSADRSKAVHIMDRESMNFLRLHHLAEKRRSSSSAPVPTIVSTCTIRFRWTGDLTSCRLDHPPSPSTELPRSDTGGRLVPRYLLPRRRQLPSSPSPPSALRAVLSLARTWPAHPNLLRR